MCSKDFNSTVNTMKTNDGSVWYDREISNTAGGHTYKYILPFLAPPSSGGICFWKTDILKSAGQQGCHCPDHSSAATSTAAITQEMLPRVFHPSDNYQISSSECQELPAVRRLQCDSRSRWVSPGAREMTDRMEQCSITTFQSRVLWSNLHLC